ncbi:MAG: type II toxin-antitoxin system prevent-host-death family antitoxin [Nitrospinota bacterium]|jgi:prevent-host-death family protein
MIKVGLREVNIHFSKYMKMVKKGSEIVLTDRGSPIAVIKPLAQKEGSPEDRIKLLEEQGILQKAVKVKIPMHRLISISGKPVSKIVIEGRENRI